MVSTTVFQTFQYDERLDDGSAYLIVDYTIQRNDTTHSSYVTYACFMAVLYCFGIPAASWVALRHKKDRIKKLGVNSKEEAEWRIKDPLLFGLSPLYQDYEKEYWWFEIPKFTSTLIFSALVTVLPTEGASQVFVSLMVSVGVMMLFANAHPYSESSDDILAQFCQTSLTFSTAVGLLELASMEFQVRLWHIAPLTPPLRQP